MATTLYLKQQNNSVAGLYSFLSMEDGTDFFLLESGTGSGFLSLEPNYQYASLIRSVLAFVTALTNTVASGSNIQMTQTANGVLVHFISPPFAAQTIISGTVTFNLWGYESSAAANATLEISLAQYTANGSQQSPFLTSSFGTELGTSAGVCNWTGSPTSTTFAIGDRLVVECLITNATATTMGGGDTVTMDYAGVTSAANGDCFITFTETISFQTEAEIIQVAGGGASVTMPGKTAVGNLFYVYADYTQGGSLVSVTDGVNPSYTQIGANTGLSGLLGYAHYYAPNLAAGGPYTITANPAGGTTLNEIQVVEVAGVLAAPYVPSSGEMNTALTGNAISTTSFTTPPGNVIILSQTDCGSAFTPGVAFLQVTAALAAESQSVTAPTASTGNWTQASSTVWLVTQASFYWGTQPPPIDEDFWNDSGLPSRVAMHYRDDPVVMVW